LFLRGLVWSSKFAALVRQSPNSPVVTLTYRPPHFLADLNAAVLVFTTFFAHCAWLVSFFFPSMRPFPSRLPVQAHEAKHRRSCFQSNIVRSCGLLLRQGPYGASPFATSPWYLDLLRLLGRRVRPHVFWFFSLRLSLKGGTDFFTSTLSGPPNQGFSAPPIDPWAPLSHCEQLASSFSRCHDRALAPRTLAGFWSVFSSPFEAVCYWRLGF